MIKLPQIPLLDHPVIELPIRLKIGIQILLQGDKRLGNGLGRHAAIIPLNLNPRNAGVPHPRDVFVFVARVGGGANPAIR